MAYAIKNIPAPRDYPLATERDEEARHEAPPHGAAARYFDMLWANIGLVLGIATLATLAGLAYAMFATPVYRATILFQVEDVGGLPRAVSPTDALRPFDVRTAGAPELEVLRSRMVLGAAVDKTDATLQLEPRYLPVIGPWLARHGIELTPPGWLGQGGYAWGAAQAQVPVFTVPPALEGERFTLTAGSEGRWKLAAREHGIALTGRVGDTVNAQVPGGVLQIRVAQLRARPGTEFKLQRDPRLVTVEKLQRDIEVGEKGRQSGIIAVSLEDSNPRKAAAILDEVVAQYLQQNEERRSEGAEKQLAFLSRQIPELRQTLERSEERYNEARNRRGSVDLGEEAKGLLQMAVASQTRLFELGQKRTELAARFEPAHPQMQAVAEQQRIATQELNSINARIKRLPQIEQEILRLSRDVKVNTEVYTNVMNAAQQLRLASASKVGNVRLLDRPEVPVKPVKPRKAIVVLSAAMAGLLLGLLAVLVRKSLGGRIYSPGEVEQTLGMPVGAVLLHSPRSRPLLRRGRGNRKDGLLPSSPPRDAAAEGLRRLQAALFPRGFRSIASADSGSGSDLAPLSALEAPRQVNVVIAVIGPTPGVGKSFVSSNLALVLASSGKRVLLVDADLRHGGLHREFGLERGHGLAEAIELGAPVEGSLHRNVVPHVDFLSTGVLPAMPARLLGHANFGRLLENFASRYDVVIIDTAPVLAVADTLMIVPHADMLLNVVRSGVTTINEIEEVDRQLRRSGARDCEVVFNDMKSKQSHYGYSTAYA